MQRTTGVCSLASWGGGTPLDRRSVLAENPVTRRLSALCQGAAEVDWGGGAENGGSINWAFMRPSCGLYALTAVDGTAAGHAFGAALVVSLLQGRERGEALARACGAGAIAASRPGVQPSLPTVAELGEILAR